MQGPYNHTLDEHTRPTQPYRGLKRKRPYGTSKLARALSEGNAATHGLNLTVDTLTEDYITLLKKSLSSIKFILGDIIFEYQYEIDIVSRAIHQITTAQDLVGQGAAENRGQDATNINGNADTLNKTYKNMKDKIDIFESVKPQIEEMILRLNDPENVKAIKLYSLIMFLGNTFETVNVDFEHFVDSLFPKDLVDIFTEKFEELGLYPENEVPADLIDRELRRYEEHFKKSKIDEVALQQENYERDVQREETPQLDFVLIHNGELQTEADSPEVRDKILTILANRIYQRYSSPTREDLETINGQDIYRYAERYVSYMQKDIAKLTKDGTTLLKEIMTKLTTKMKLPVHNKIIVAINEQIESVSNSRQAEKTIQHSRSPIQKIAIIGYHVMKNIFLGASKEISISVKNAYDGIRSSVPVNMNTYESIYKIPKPLESLILNSDILSIVTNPEYRDVFFENVYTNTVQGKMNGEIRKIILEYTGNRSRMSLSQGDDPIIINTNFNPREVQERLKQRKKNHTNRGVNDFLRNLQGRQSAAAAEQEQPPDYTNVGGKKMKKNKRKTVKKRKTKKNNKVEKKKKRRNRKSKKN